MAFAGQMHLFSLLALALLVTGAHQQLLFPLAGVRWFTLVVSGNVLGLIFASERSAWLGFAFGAFFILLMVSWRLTLKISAVSAVVAVVAWNALPVFQKRLLPLLDWQHDVGTRARLTLWTEAFRLFQQNPLFGVGLRKFPHLYIPEALVPGQARYLGHAHSNYLQMLATTGLFGFGMYCWLICASIKLAVSQFLAPDPGSLGPVGAIKRKLGVRQAIGLGLTGALVSLAVAGIFEYNFGTSQVRLAEWFLLALLVPPCRSQPKSV
jgi:O-antigen ligase